MFPRQFTKYTTTFHHSPDVILLSYTPPSSKGNYSPLVNSIQVYNDTRVTSPLCSYIIFTNSTETLYKRQKIHIHYAHSCRSTPCPRVQDRLSTYVPPSIYCTILTIVFTPTILSGARSEWLQILQDRMAALDNARTCVGDEFAYGGAGAVVGMFTDLENAVDSARRMVYALGSEMRRRSEGELPIWNKVGGVTTMTKVKST
jgi:hypothetical protein